MAVPSRIFTDRSSAISPNSAKFALSSHLSPSSSWWNAFQRIQGTVSQRNSSLTTLGSKTTAMKSRWMRTLRMTSFKIWQLSANKMCSRLELSRSWPPSKSPLKSWSTWSRCSYASIRPRMASWALMSSNKEWVRFWVWCAQAHKIGMTWCTN